MKVVKLGGAAPSAVATGVVGTARKERNGQLRLMRYQIAVEKGETKTDKVIDLAKREIELILKFRGQLKSQPVSDYSALQTLADTEFKGVTQEILAMEASVKAEKEFKALLSGTPKQMEVIAKYHGLRAKKNWDVIQTTYQVLKRFHKAIEAPATVAEIPATADTVQA